MRPSTDDFQFIAGNLALDFVNTVGDRLGDAREYLTSSAELSRWARRAGILAPHARMALRPRQLAAVRAARDDLHRLFHRIALGAVPSPRSVGALNARLETVAKVRRLRSHRGTVSWEWLSSPRDPRVLLAQVFGSAAELLVSGDFRHVRQCDGELCGWLFVDRSPAGRRRWCSMADCGNRAKARRHLATVRRTSR